MKTSGARGCKKRVVNVGARIRMIRAYGPRAAGKKFPPVYPRFTFARATSLLHYRPPQRTWIRVAHEPAWDRADAMAVTSALTPSGREWQRSDWPSWREIRA